MKVDRLVFPEVSSEETLNQVGRRSRALASVDPYVDAAQKKSVAGGWGEPPATGKQLKNLRCFESSVPNLVIRAR